MDFIEIIWQSEFYRQEIELRDRLLRLPWGWYLTGPSWMPNNTNCTLA